MGFLKQFFEPNSEYPQIPKAPAPSIQRKPASMLLTPPKNEDLKPTKENPSQRIGQCEQIRSIESKALGLGWTLDQLWRDSKRWNEKGLVCFLKPEHQIDTVTSQFIEVSWLTPQGVRRSSRYYNMRVDQPWLKHS